MLLGGMLRWCWTLELADSGGSGGVEGFCLVTCGWPGLSQLAWLSQKVNAALCWCVSVGVIKSS